MHSRTCTCACHVTLLLQNVSAASYGYVIYSSQYALRLCMEQGLEEACVHIYAAMGLYEEAVDLSLKVRRDGCGMEWAWHWF